MLGGLYLDSFTVMLRAIGTPASVGDHIWREAASELEIDRIKKRTTMSPITLLLCSKGAVDPPSVSGGRCYSGRRVSYFGYNPCAE